MKTKSKKYSQVHVRLDESQMLCVKTLAKAKGKSISEIIRWSIENIIGHSKVYEVYAGAEWKYYSQKCFTTREEAEDFIKLQENHGDCTTGIFKIREIEVE